MTRVWLKREEGNGAQIDFNTIGLLERLRTVTLQAFASGPTPLSSAKSFAFCYETASAILRVATFRLVLLSFFHDGERRTDSGCGQPQTRATVAGGLHPSDLAGPLRVGLDRTRLAPKGSVSVRLHSAVSKIQPRAHHA